MYNEVVITCAFRGSIMIRRVTFTTITTGIMIRRRDGMCNLIRLDLRAASIPMHMSWEIQFRISIQMV